MVIGRLITCCLLIVLATAPAAGSAAPFKSHGFPVYMADRGKQESRERYDDRRGRDSRRDRDGGGISLDEAVSRARGKGNGKVLSAETVRSNNNKVHRIKILTRDGRVKRMDIDARTGRPAPRQR